MEYKVLVRKGLLAGCVAISMVVFFFLYSFLSITSLSEPSIRLNSPDETANYFFSRLTATTGDIRYREDLLSVTDHFLHPRSMVGVNGYVAPVSFVGMPYLYGSAARLFGIDILLFITPLLALIIPLLFYRFLRSIFSFRIAGLSALLLAIHPAYWYFANRAMMHNILFFGLLIAGLAALASIRGRFASAAPRRIHFGRIALMMSGALMLGTSLTVRVSEIVWVIPLLLVIACFFWRKTSWWAVMIFIIGFAAPLFFVFASNARLYGNPASFGYHGYGLFSLAPTLDAIDAASTAVRNEHYSSLGLAIDELYRGFDPLWKYILPFGYDPEVFSEHFIQYFAKLFWWFVLPIALGTLLLIRRGLMDVAEKRNYALIAYSICSSLIFYWMVAYYGSWIVQDNITNIPTIGNSYVRYWLLLYALSLPGIAALFVWMFDRARWYGLQRLIVVSMLACLVLYSYDATYLRSNDSLAAIAASIRDSQHKLSAVRDLTEPNSVIVSQRSDKHFFPERRVMESVENFNEAPLVRALLDAGLPVYYYGLWEQDDADYISKRYFSNFGFELVFHASVVENEHLYRAVSASPDSDFRDPSLLR
ncbi:hypothetical protein HYV71_00930 [Candidatus Uhrbacteria bacterium]|nr:hypothetical protein [Candidatus Uhrbacteria bacterium]